MHEESKIIHVIICVELPIVPLVRTFRVLARFIAFFDCTKFVFIHFLRTMMIFNRNSGRKLRNNVFEVSDARVREMFFSELVVLLISKSRLSKVDDLDFVAVFNKTHTCKMCHSCSKTVSSGFNFVMRELLFETFYFPMYTKINIFSCLLPSFVHLTFTFRPLLVFSLKGVDVSDPVRNRRGTSKYDIDRVVGR